MLVVIDVAAARGDSSECRPPNQVIRRFNVSVQPSRPLRQTRKHLSGHTHQHHMLVEN